MIFTTAPHYLCLDCGGTKTAAALVSPTGDVVARGYAGPSNFKDIGLEAFIQSVKLASSSALATATGAPVTLPPPTPLIAAVWVGASGIDSGADIKILTPILSELFGIPAGKRLIISNDSHLLASPLRLYKDISNALVTIAGTGTVVVSFGTRDDGGLQEVARAGGWGWMLGDEGSAYHVGREAIRQILQEFNQQALSDCPLPPRPTSAKPTLRERILDHYSLSSPDELFSVVYATEPNPLTSPPVSKKQQPYLAQERKFRLSGLSPLIFSSAFDDGDEMALAVLRKCTDALAESACGLLRHPGSPITKGREKAILASETVLCLGGSLVGVPKYRDMYLEAFKKQGHVFGHVQFVEDAAEGGARALWSMFAA